MFFCENIAGFTQDESSNGNIELHEKLLAALDDYSPLSVRVRYRRHNENWKAIALNYHYMRRRYYNEPFIIQVNAYSYGAGHGLTRLAKQLQRYNIKVNIANICDGVYYHWHPLGWWRALIGNSRIKLPNNVEKFHAFYQRKNTPHGRPLDYNPAMTQALSWTELFVEHEWMDDDLEWHNHCITVAKEYAKKGVVSKQHIPANAPKTAATEMRQNH